MVDVLLSSLSNSWRGHLPGARCWPGVRQLQRKQCNN